VSWSRRALVGLIRLYQMARAGHPSPCRYWPSCSAYASEAIAVHGVVRGSALGMVRLARCRPGGGFGVDEVPFETRPGSETEPLEGTVDPCIPVLSKSGLSTSVLAGKS